MKTEGGWTGGDVGGAWARMEHGRFSGTSVGELSHILTDRRAAISRQSGHLPFSRTQETLLLAWSHQTGTFAPYSGSSVRKNEKTPFLRQISAPQSVRPASSREPVKNQLISFQLKKTPPPALIAGESVLIWFQQEQETVRNTTGGEPCARRSLYPETP